MWGDRIKQFSRSFTFHTHRFPTASSVDVDIDVSYYFISKYLTISRRRTSYSPKSHLTARETSFRHRQKWPTKTPSTRLNPSTPIPSPTLRVLELGLAIPFSTQTTRPSPLSLPIRREPLEESRLPTRLVMDSARVRPKLRREEGVGASGVWILREGRGS